MKYDFDGYNYLVILNKGELLVKNLTKLFVQEKLNSYWISGLGASLWAELGFYNLKTKEYEIKRFEKPLEILSLQGNTTWDGDKPVFHIHGNFADENYKGIGGHVKELQVAGTCEIFLHKWYKDKLSRKLDDDTGLKLIDL